MEKSFVLAPTDGQSFVLNTSGGQKFVLTCGQCFTLVPAVGYKLALAPTGGQYVLSSNLRTIYALGPTDEHPLALDLSFADEACGNWLSVLHNIHQLCCLFDKINHL